jgi:micrococcal nuclease
LPPVAGEPPRPPEPPDPLGPPAPPPVVLAERPCPPVKAINRKGERIYHVPGGRSYASTLIDTTRGERWFCSEGEAQAAGWRRAMQ